MKVRHIENARLVMMASYIAARVFVANDDTVFSEVNNFLLSNGISMEDITPYMSFAYNASILTGFQLEQLCKDYARMEIFYNTVVCNIAELIEAFGIENDPVKIFALYVYLYISGYLSVNHEFKYSNNMIDFPLLNGVGLVAVTKINLPYYNEIDRLTKDQHGMIKRMFPIIPVIRRK